jgi:hypothetical protein
MCAEKDLVEGVESITVSGDVNLRIVYGPVNGGDNLLLFG